MTIQYLVDTDWAIHYLNDHEGIVPCWWELQRQRSLAPSIISLAELYERVYIHARLKKMKPRYRIFSEG